MQKRSLIRQVVAIVLTAQILCAVVLSALALQHERGTRLRAFDVRLQGRSDSLLGAIQDAEDPEDNVTIDPRELKLPPEDVYAVYNQAGQTGQAGRLLGSSPDAPPTLIQRTANGFRDERVNGVQYRVLQREGIRIIDRPEYGGVGLSRPVVILYASPETHLWHEIAEAAGFYLTAIAVVAVLTAIAAVLFLRRTLRPLAEFATAASEISLPVLAFTPPQSVMETRELHPLAQALSSVIAGLREAFERERRFMGDAAHELKTAVAVVRSSAQILMLKSRTSEEYSAGLQRVVDDNERVETLIGQMLQLARVEEQTGKTQDCIDFAEAARSAVAHLEPMARIRGVQLTCYCTGAPCIRLQAGRALTLIVNLVQNAIQHSDADASVEVFVRSTETAEILEVVDTGRGIRADALPHVFERFFREDQSRSRETGGAGLGLAICKSIVESAGGTIRIVSEPGEGTVVTATFMKA